jgi:predicted aldo/keto reductase-like oxidoreductase
MYIGGLEMLKKRRLGRTELYVTELGFGAMNLRRTGSFEAAYSITHKVLDAGINLIDTARAYKGECEGRVLESERVLGEVIASRTDLSDMLVIVTKGHGYTPDALYAELDESRRALGVTGYHDLYIGGNPVKLVYFLHGLKADRWDVVQSSGVMAELSKIKSKGLVNFVGFSSHYHDGKEIREAIDSDVFDVCELPYNVFNRSLGEDGETDLIKYAYKHDVGVVCMKAFDGSGMNSAYPILKDYMKVDYRQMLNFCLSNGYISTVDAGIRFDDELRLDVEVAVGPRMTDREMKAVKSEADKVAGHTRNICRECTHCMEKFTCPQGINFMEALSNHSRYNLAKAFGRDSSVYAERYRAMERSGRDCTGCGGCLAWCEYKLKVPGMLGKAERELRVDG